MKKEKTEAINRREFLGSAVAASVLAAAATANTLPDDSQQQTRPNVLFILADDLGWGDLSCYGRPDYRTPNLDRLASEGTRFTQAYSASPVCTPTRCAFMTGQYPARHAVGLREPLRERKIEGGRVGLAPGFPTVASHLGARGYETALIGKWHLGYLPKYGPLKSGFNEFYGIMSGAGDYFKHEDMTGTRDFFQNETPVTPERTGYMTDLLTERAIEFLKRRRTKPFYLSLHYTAPHWPWEGPRDVELSRTIRRGYDEFRGGGSFKIYAEMMRSLDDGIGRVLQTLRDARLARDTLVIFTSDNGGERFSYNWPFRGEKGELLEGGIRVPAIVRWPGIIPGGRVTEQVAITMDWMATILAAAGAKPDSDGQHKLDGLDLLPILQSKSARSQVERTLFWRHDVQTAVRAGRWKYWMDGNEEYLFDLLADERENADYKKTRPREFAQLKAEFMNWDKQVLPRLARSDQ
ncbi:MAG: sulfatase-like hydrolase/transferase [Acidobacteria bacterium]|nr:sulfatase-like hydrolase/transferase [Acidobacteriota bacterium]